jgi:hypothetical protein
MYYFLLAFCLSPFGPGAQPWPWCPVGGLIYPGSVLSDWARSGLGHGPFNSLEENRASSPKKTLEEKQNNCLPCWSL